MTSDVTRDEFTHLGVRVDVLEREVEGEKMVTRHILDQTRHNSDDLATIRTEMRQEFSAVRQDITGLRTEMTGLRAMLVGLTTNLPTMIADVMRQVLRER